MEIKDKLDFPWGEDERYNFIVRNNHEKGYDIREYPDRLEAWGETEKEKEEREKKQREEFLAHLTCTKRVMVLMLEKLGKDYYNDILPLIEASNQAKLEWDLCVELERCNPLIDQIGLQLGISAEQIDRLFLYANGHVDSLEVSNEQ